MNRQEAERIIEQMKTGLAFSDEDMFTNEYWSFSYDPEKKTFDYLSAWTVIGSILSNIHYSEESALNMLQSDFEYKELMELGYQQDGFSEVKGERPNDETAPTQKIPNANSSSSELWAFWTELCQSKNIELLQAWLISTDNKINDNLFSMACRYGFTEGVKILVDKGATPYSTDSRYSALYSTCDGENENPELLEFLLKTFYPKEHKDIHEALIACAQNDHIKSTEILLARGANINTKKSSHTPLMYAAQNNRLQMVKCLVKHGSKINATNDSGENALVLTIAQGDFFEVADVLINAGIKLEDGGKYGHLPLRSAAGYGRTEIVKLLLQQKITIDLRVSDNSSIADRTATALGEACQNEHWDIAELLLDIGADPNIPDGFGQYPLQRAASAGRIDLVKKMIHKKADVTSKADFSGTVLTDACDSGNLEIVKLIIEHGANVEVHNGFTGEYPLHIASYNGHLDIVKYLIENKAEINSLDSRGNTPLHHAAWTGKTEIVNHLISSGADLKLKNKFNWNVLMQACDKGYLETVKVLIPYFKNDLLNKGTERGETALEIAKHSGNKGLVDFLLENGAH